MEKQILVKLKNNGWAEYENISNSEDLIELANMIGEIVKHPNGQLIFTLRPRHIEEAIKGTFSNNFGHGEFPLHTDTAFWPTPVRYIILSSEQVSDCSTTITSLRSIFKHFTDREKEDVSRAIFKIKTIHSQFYSSLLFKQDNISGIKYDSTYMFAANSFALKFEIKLKEVMKMIKPVEIKWTGNLAIVVDNWNNLHGRKSLLENKDRELKRIYIK